MTDYDGPLKVEGCWTPETPFQFVPTDAGYYDSLRDLPNHLGGTPLMETRQPCQTSRQGAQSL